MVDKVADAPSKEIGVTIELEAEKPVEIDVSTLIEKGVQPEKKADEEKPEEKGIEIEVPINRDDEPDPVAELKAQLEELRAKANREHEEAVREREKERAARELAERNAQQMNVEMGRREFELLETKRHAIENAIAAHRADADALERTLAYAATKNDHATSAKAQRALMRIEAELLQLDEGLSQVKGVTEAGVEEFLKRRPAQRYQPEQRQQQPQQQKPITREDYLAQRTPRVRQFLESKDPSWITDDRMNKKLIAAHWDALSNGFVEESDGYFDHISKAMEPPKKADPKADLKPAKKPAPAAPGIAKAVAAQNGVNGMKVHLTPRERERAKDLNLSEEEYARRKYIMSQPNWDGPRFD